MDPHPAAAVGDGGIQAGEEAMASEMDISAEDRNFFGFCQDVDGK